jgi:hypothetical protein
LVVGEGEVRMAPADDVYFGDGVFETRSNLTQDFFKRELKALRIARLSGKGAKAAAIHADVGIVDVLVHDIISGIAVEPPAHLMSQGADGCHIGAGEKEFAILQSESLATLDFLINVLEAKSLIPCGINHDFPVRFGAA